MPNLDSKQTLYASTGWMVEDIKSLKPHWSDSKCVAFLEHWDSKIVEQMVLAGWNAIEEALEEEKDDSAVGSD